MKGIMADQRQTKAIHKQMREKKTRGKRKRSCVGEDKRRRGNKGRKMNERRKAINTLQHSCVGL